MTDKHDIHLTVDGEPTVVEGKPITLLYHAGTYSVKVTDPDVVEIDPERTVRCAREVAASGNWGWLRMSPVFRDMWSLIWGEVPPPEDLAAAPLGMQHVAGMLVLLVGVIKAGERPFLRLPETYLHPKQQLGLGDLLVRLSKPAAPNV